MSFFISEPPNTHPHYYFKAQSPFNLKMVLNAAAAAGMTMMAGVTAAAAYKGGNNGAMGGGGSSWESRSRSGSNTSTSSGFGGNDGRRNVDAWGKKHSDTTFQQKFWQ